ncbi:hypothetical protein AAG570_002611 [Ranatra chinensis]|uniref:Uncharacterized protein n=1 Tax=Ranatra chinensis TaxID=642074 RepID=A0ABD0Y912_9HEMI
MILKPTWAYGLELWGSPRNSNIDRIQSFKSKTFRTILDVPWNRADTSVRGATRTGAWRRTRIGRKDMCVLALHQDYALIVIQTRQPFVPGPTPAGVNNNPGPSHPQIRCPLLSGRGRRVLDGKLSPAFPNDGVTKQSTELLRGVPVILSSTYTKVEIVPENML